MLTARGVMVYLRGVSPEDSAAEMEVRSLGWYGWRMGARQYVKLHRDYDLPTSPYTVQSISQPGVAAAT